MKKELKNYLLSVARKAIADELEISFGEPVEPDGHDAELTEKTGVFVTLEINGRLRGCIGNILPVYPLFEAVRKNAVNAAFEDPRFMPLEPEEFDDVEIEISVLSVPKKLSYKNSGDLLKKLRPGIDGVILKKGYYEATYLPQVWGDLHDKEEFLSSLCVKAGMDSGEWKKGGVTVSIYEVEAFR